MKLLEWLVTSNLQDTAFESFDEWHPAFLHGISGWSLPIEWAVVGGCVGDRLAYAFAAGYQSALRRLFPFLPVETVASFCVTEAGGGHPRAIQCRLILAGDGYLNYIKPFRTVEDLHVFGGILGYLFRVATLHQLDTRLREDILACIVTAHHLAGMFASKTPVHLALAGFIRQFRALILAFEFHLAQVDEATRSRWMRDKQLFTIAESVREKRRESAWEKVIS